jgi:hypothetical protein
MAGRGGGQRSRARRRPGDGAKWRGGRGESIPVLTLCYGCLKGRLHGRGGLEVAALWCSRGRGLGRGGVE